MHDIATAVLCFIFGIFSLVWPATGRFSIGDLSLLRGWFIGPLWLLAGAGILWFCSRSIKKAPECIRFVRRFYPELLFGFLFMESIRLSSVALGGTAHDAAFARFDLWLFGCEPSLVLASAAWQRPVLNEIMFGSYFLFYPMLALTPMIPYFRGDLDEAEREESIFSFFMLVLFIFYVFFRVEGPKYWVDGLEALRYGEFKGGIFTLFFTGLIFPDSILSGAAFPSSHVAISALMTVYAAKTMKKLLPLYIAVCLLIAMATVYIYAHWTADVLAGFLCCAVLVPPFNAFFRWTERRRRLRIGENPDAWKK